MQTWQEPSAHIEIPHKHKTYLRDATSRVQKLCGHAKHVDRYAWHCNTHKYSGNHQYCPSKPKSPNSPTGSTRSCADKMGGSRAAQVCWASACMRMAIGRAQEGVQRCQKCQTYLLGGKIAHRRASEARKPNGHMQRYRVLLMTREQLKTHRKLSKRLQPPNSPGRSPKSHPEEPKRLQNVIHAEM